MIKEDKKEGLRRDKKAAEGPSAKPLQPRAQGREVGTGGHTEEIEVLKTKMEEYLNGWKRAKADYLNLKNETEKQLKDTVMFANASLIFELLPVIDNFDRAIVHMPNQEKKTDWVKGVIQIQKQLEDILKLEGVEKIKTMGAKFNPEFHEAITMEEKKGEESGVISEEVEAGYKLNDKVLRPAKVKVAK